MLSVVVAGWRGAGERRLSLGESVMRCDSCRHKRQCVAECLGYEPYGPFHVKPPRANHGEPKLIYSRDLEALECAELRRGHRVRVCGVVEIEKH